MIPIVKTLLFTLLVPGTVTILLPCLLLSLPVELFPFSLGMFKYTGILLMGIGISIYLWCAWDFAFSGKGTPS